MGRFDSLRKWALAGLATASSWLGGQTAHAQYPVYYVRPIQYYPQPMPANAYYPNYQQNSYPQQYGYYSGAGNMMPSGPAMIYYYPSPTQMPMQAPAQVPLNGSWTYWNPQPTRPTTRTASPIVVSRQNTTATPSKTPAVPASTTTTATVVATPTAAPASAPAAPLPTGPVSAQTAELLPPPKTPTTTQASPGATIVSSDDTLPPSVCTDCAPHCHHFSISGDTLWWTLRGDTIPFAQITNGFTDPPQPGGPVGVVDSQYNIGVRLNASYSLSPRNEVYGVATWWQDRSSAHTFAPDDPNLVVTPLAVVPATLITIGPSLTAVAQQDTHLIMGDLGFKHLLCGNDDSFVKLTVGARYAHLDENFYANYVFAELTHVGTKINFDGGGPRVGLEGAYTLGCRMYLYGRADLSLLYGHYSASYVERNALLAPAIEANTNDDRVTPILDTELGLGWKSKNGHIQLMLGYSAMNWFNAMSTSSWIQSVQDNTFATNRNNLSDTLSFDGPFVRVLFQY